ncbi:hypothetical protein ACFC5X_05565 [Streptomyces sp. NPDC055952]
MTAALLTDLAAESLRVSQEAPRRPYAGAPHAARRTHGPGEAPVYSVGF